MANQFKSASSSYIERANNGTDTLGNVLYSNNSVLYTYLFSGYVFGLGNENEFDLFD